MSMEVVRRTNDRAALNKQEGMTGMRLTSKARHAVASMVDLALFGGHGPVSLSAMAQRQGISVSYLEQLFSLLRRARLVRSVRGPGGGYALTDDPNHIKLGSILLAMAADNPAVTRRSRTIQAGEDESALVGGGEAVAHCQDLWQRVDLHVFTFMNDMVLADLLPGDSQARRAGRMVGAARPSSASFQESAIAAE
jgi:Rrf2 family transcriptional regulator, iron-sulfur cluster assembly transcription factor